MNFSSIIGICMGAAVIYAALTATSNDLKFFMDFHGILIVCGGTLAAASISFPIIDVILLIKIFLLRVLTSHKTRNQEMILQILELHKKTTLGVTALNEVIPTIKHPFLKEAIQLISTGIATEQEIRINLEQRLKTAETQLMHEANMFRVIGRFPPAFGLLATTLGMIGLLQKIGQPDSQKLIGPAMSIGLIGTLYGIALSNLIFIPIAENLTERTHEELKIRRMIIEGVMLFKAQVTPTTLRERLNSFVLPKHRSVRKAA